MITLTFNKQKKLQQYFDDGFMLVKEYTDLNKNSYIYFSRHESGKFVDYKIWKGTLKDFYSYKYKKIYGTFLLKDINKKIIQKESIWSCSNRNCQGTMGDCFECKTR